MLTRLSSLSDVGASAETGYWTSSEISGVILAALKSSMFLVTARVSMLLKNNLIFT